MFGVVSKYLKYPEKESVMATAEVVSGPLIASVTERIQHEAFSCLVPSCRYSPLESGDAFVPDINWLYAKVRSGRVNSRYPLTLEEARPFIRCKMHTFGEPGLDFTCREKIERMHPLRATMGLMERFAVENAERIAAEKERKRQRAYQERLATAPARRAICIANEKGFVNPTLSSALQHHEHHKHGKRLSAAKRRMLAMEAATKPKHQEESKRKNKKGKDRGKQGGNKHGKRR